jgi:PAS domain S-box-containing protein
MGVETAEERLRLITETISEVVWVAKFDVSRVIYVSPAYERLWGRSCQSLYENPRSFIEAIHPDDRARVLRNLEAENEGGPFDHEYRIIRPDGTQRWVWDRGYPVRTPGGKVDRYVGVAQDVTERKRAEDELASTAQRLSLVSRATSDAIWDWDVVTGSMWWSDVHFDVLGYDRRTIPSYEAWANRVHPEDRARVLASVRQALERGAETWFDEYRFVLPDGSTRWILDRAYALYDDAGKPIRMVGSMLDVTKQRQLEIQLRQAQKVEAVGQLAGSIAHDFNNILSIVVGYADLVLGSLGPGNAGRDEVDEIRRAAMRGAELTRQLLAFSRQQVLQPRTTDLAAIVAGMTQMLRRLIGEDIELAIEGAGAALVWVDPTQITQVILNLAVNARDAMPRGGRLTMRTMGVVVGGQDGQEDGREHVRIAPGRYVVLAVSDSGTGMDAATQAQIFEPYFTTKEPGRGTGLGLATVQGIVAQSGGSIVTVSELGHGTTFRLYFPEAAAGEAASHDGDDARGTGVARRGAGETVLLVEDDHALRAMLKVVLQKQGYRVLEAPNGREGLLLSQDFKGPIDLVLTDVVMPYMSGREFVERLAGLRNGIKAVFMSGYTDGVLDEHGVLDRKSTFLQKPVTPAALIEKVREVLAVEPASSSAAASPPGP